MRADGSGQKRLTNVPGYDGGPFFTHDGKRIVWRRFDEQGLIADVWTMNLDGTDQKQITDFGSMSWAPHMHPSGAVFIFASNKLGFENFEVFIVDAKGEKEPVRVTYYRRLRRAARALARRNAAGLDVEPGPAAAAGQLFLAQWNHEKALQALADAPPKKPASKS